MTYEEVTAMLRETGLPVTYYAWIEGTVPALPYLVYYYPSTDNFSADDSVYTIVQRLNVELYTERKDFELEATVESVLDAHRVFWNKSETFIESELMYEVLYEMEVMIRHGE